MSTALSAVVLVGSLKASSEPSSSEVLGRQVLDALHGPPHPVGDGVRGDGEADVVEGLVELGAHVVRAVLVADHGHGRDLAGGEHPPFLVGLGQLGVEPLESALGDARRLTHPDRRRDHEDVGREDLLADERPLVTVAHVDLDPWADVVVGEPDDRPDDPVLGKCVEDLTSEDLAARGFGRGLE